ncbi:MAG: ABC transporter ATP-binding protein [Syntrophomonadaceae bacterium]|nr:ABC transporter ATP-binding protein [Syntrophomonadaceae bacterium]
MDEVLAVGDAEFQKKCLGKMGDVASREGRTVLFVSHNMGAIMQLCPFGIWLDNGKINSMGESHQLVDEYIRRSNPSYAKASTDFSKPENQPIWISQAKIYCDGKLTPVAKYGDDLCVEITFQSTKPITRPGLGLAIQTEKNEMVINTNNRYLLSPEYRDSVTKGVIRFQLGELPLMTGRYSITLWIGENANTDHLRIDNALTFDVLENDAWGRGWMPTKKMSYFWWPTTFEFN